MNVVHVCIDIHSSILDMYFLYSHLNIFNYITKPSYALYVGKYTTLWSGTLFFHYQFAFHSIQKHVKQQAIFGCIEILFTPHKSIYLYMSGFILIIDIMIFLFKDIEFIYCIFLLLRFHFNINMDNVTCKIAVNSVSAYCTISAYYTKAVGCILLYGKRFVFILLWIWN